MFPCYHTKPLELLEQLLQVTPKAEKSLGKSNLYIQFEHGFGLFQVSSQIAYIRNYENTHL